jgi:hypothetical protein
MSDGYNCAKRRNGFDRGSELTGLQAILDFSNDLDIK